MNRFTANQLAFNTCNLLKVWFAMVVVLATLLPTMSKQVKLHCDSANVVWYLDGKLLEEPGNEDDYRIEIEHHTKRSSILVFHTNPGSQLICKSNITGEELLKKIIEEDMFITDVDAIVTGLFCFIALLTDILIVSSFFKNSKKGEKLQIGLTSLASVGLLFDAGWAFYLWYEHRIRGKEFIWICVANGFILLSVVGSYLHLFLRRRSRYYQTVNEKEESSKATVQI